MQVHINLSQNIIDILEFWQINNTLFQTRIINFDNMSQATLTATIPNCQIVLSDDYNRNFVIRNDNYNLRVEVTRYADCLTIHKKNKVVTIVL